MDHLNFLVQTDIEKTRNGGSYFVWLFAGLAEIFATFEEGFLGDWVQKWQN